MTLEELENYTQNIGYTSMGLEFEKFNLLSEASHETGYGMSIEELRIIYGDIAVIEDDGIFDLNCVDLSLANLVNRDGLVQIEGDLYKFSLNKIIRIKGGDASKLTMAYRLHESLESEGIFIDNLEEVSGNSRTLCHSPLDIGSPWGGNSSVTNITSRSWCFKFSGSNCKYRLRVLLQNIQTNVAEELAVNIKTHRRGAFGIWYSYNAKVEVRGDVTLNANTGFSTTRSNLYIDSWGTNRNEDLYSNEDVLGSPTSPFPPELLGGAFYNEACVDLSFQMYTDQGIQPPYYIN